MTRGIGMGGMSGMRTLPGNNDRLVLWPNTWASVAGYKAVEAANLQSPSRYVDHRDIDQG